MAKITTILTSNTSPAPYVAEASAIYNGTYDAWKAFDGNNFTYWLTPGSGVNWISFDTGSSVVARVYSITGSSDATRSPKDFTFEGFDGVDWIILDTQIGITWESEERKEFEFANDIPYLKHRLHISANNGGNRIQIGTVDIFEISEPKAKVSQLVTQVVNSGSPKAKVSQLVTQVVNSGSPKAKVSQLVVEVMYISVKDAKTNRPMIFMFP